MFFVCGNMPGREQQPVGIPLPNPAFDVQPAAARLDDGVRARAPQRVELVGGDPLGVALAVGQDARFDVDVLARHADGGGFRRRRLAT